MFARVFQCSGTCGAGTQTRKVYCSLGIDRENACDPSVKPEANRACLSDKDCSGLWFNGPWSQVRFRATPERGGFFSIIYDGV